MRDTQDTNGYHVHSTANGHAHPAEGTNGFGPAASTSKAPESLALAPEFHVNRTEFVRLTLQSLQTAGYTHAASVLASESGVGEESTNISGFRDAVLGGDWDVAVQMISRIDSAYALHERNIRYLIAQERYLELLESKETRQALAVLRNDLAPRSQDADQLHKLSSLMMCTKVDDLKRKADWYGVAQGSRQDLLRALQAFLPSEVMLPENRLATLLDHARLHQESVCPYHVAPVSDTFPLLSDHFCPKAEFPSINTRTLRRHTDQVWNVACSHDGRLLATAGKDHIIVVWDVENDFTIRTVLEGHLDGVSCLAWSPDDTLLISSAGASVKIWDVQSESCVKTLNEHTHEVTSVVWCPKGNGFLTAGMDSKIFFRDLSGEITSMWKMGPYRIFDAAISPDGTKLVAIGKAEMIVEPDALSNGSNSSGDAAFRKRAPTRSEWRLQIYDLKRRKQLSSIVLPREVTCINVSQDSQYAIVNQSPDEIRLYHIDEGQLHRRFAGHKQSTELIRNSFGGSQENFILTGSEDASVYVWNRSTGKMVATLQGHTIGSVNAVTWSTSTNSTKSPMIASVGDDATLRIWQPPPRADAR